MMRPSDFMQRNPIRLDISRSKFSMSPRWTGSFNSYQLVPIFTYTDVLPGDTWKIDTSFVVRMSTPVTPVMDDLFLDIGFYFVPHELILSRSYMSPSTNDSNHSWKAFIGAQDSLLNMPVPDSDIELPYMGVYTNNYVSGGIADCMGIPVPDTGHAYLVNALAPLAFMAVWNENYREPNTENPGVFSISSGSCVITWSAASLNSSAVIGVATLPHTCRFHGFFGSALPWPQRNSETVLLPLGSTAPINTSDTVTDFDNDLIFKDPYGVASGYHVPLSLINTSTGTPTSNPVGYDAADSKTNSSGIGKVSGSNLVADLANASAVSINVFRLAVQQQRWFEALARGGNRIDELTHALFGVMPKDAGGNQPEYLGGKRIPLQVSQVNSTANTDSGSVGQVGAFSLTADSDHYFTKSFDKWGSIIGVATVRYRDSFGYSLNRMFTRFKRFDFYFPQFANLGEMPVYQHELDIGNLTSSTGKPESNVFGYQEAWADYRTIPDIVSGLVRPGNSLSFWTYANTGSNRGNDVGTMGNNLAGFLSGYLAQNAIDRTLQVSSSTSGFTFVMQVQHSITAVRPMPTYSIPGLVDHH